MKKRLIKKRKKTNKEKQTGEPFAVENFLAGLHDNAETEFDR